MNTSYQPNNNDFNSRIKVEGITKNVEYERKKFLDYLATNLDLLENFSTEQLQTLLKYSEEENEKKRKKLKKLNNQ